MQKEVNSFLNKYEKISSSDDFRANFCEDQTKTCKFCGQTSKEVSFKNIPHVIPELLGKNNFTTNEECDICNAKFGLYENDLANFVSPYLTLLSHKTKKKIPQFQSRKENGGRSTTIKSVGGQPNINFGTNHQDFEYDYKKNLINFRFRKKEFIPVNVYKSLVHVALSLCPMDEIKYFQDTIDWVLGRESKVTRPLDIPLIAYRTRFSNKKFNNPSAHLFRRRNNFDKKNYIPRSSLVLYSGMLAFQIYLPWCSETRDFEVGSYSLELDVFPAFFLDLNFPKRFEQVTLRYEQLPVVQYDFNHDQKVKEDELLTGRYMTLIRN